jgi:Spy/CpxP family protein refolding chaperone
MKKALRSPLAILLIVAVAAAFVATAAIAADEKAPANGRGQHEQWAKELGLTDKQQADIQAIIHDYTPKIQDIQKSTSLTADQKTAKVEELRKEMISKIEAILTPEQRAKAAKMLHPRSINPPATPGAQAHGQWFGRLIEKLDLTADQKTKITAVRDDNEAKMKAIQADASLNQDQKRTKMMDVRKGTMAKIMDILTPEQREQLKKLRAEHPGPGAPPPAGK